MQYNARLSELPAFVPSLWQKFQETARGTRRVTTNHVGHTQCLATKPRFKNIVYQPNHVKSTLFSHKTTFQKQFTNKTTWKAHCLRQRMYGDKKKRLTYPGQAAYQIMV